MKAKTKRNLLVILADKNYVEQAKQLFSSVYFNAGWKGDYMLFAYKIPEKELKWFRKKGILVKKCKPLSHKDFSRWPASTLSKFYLFTPEFKKWKNIVYLDADIIVRASLDKLTKIKGLAAFGTWKLSKHFLNPIHIKLEKIDRNILNRLKKDYNLNEISFNTGVMAFSTDLIEKDTFSKLKKLFELYNKINAVAEGSIINLMFYKKWKKLPFVYNVGPDHLINFNNVESEKIRGIILHFLGSKPWNTTNYFYREWKSNLKRAELINLKKIQNAKIWTKKEIEEYSLYLENMRKCYSYKYTFFKIKLFIDRHIGLLGIFLKNNFPKLYYFLKK